MRNALITTDIHLTEKNEDAYRFGLFEWIIETFGHDITDVYILGDVTDRKNYHADWFVNRVADTLQKLSQWYHVNILMGNHDYDTSPDNPFFQFINQLPRVRYFTKPYMDVNEVLFLPHSRQPGEDWGILRKETDPRVIFLHQTFRGARSETGHELTGMSTLPFRKYGCPIYSGDIHVPQNVGPVTYVGSPYHTRYGDSFNPRCLIVDKDFEIVEEVQFPAPRKWAIDLNANQHLEDLEYLGEGDMVKIRVHLTRIQFDDWPVIRDTQRAQAKDMGLKVHSITLKEKENTKERSKRLQKKIVKGRTRSDTFKAFCTRYGVSDDLAEAGKEFMES